MTKPNTDFCRVSDKLLEKVHFANFAKEYKITPYDLAQLLVLAKRRYNAEVLLCNEPDTTGKVRKREEKARSEFEQLAKVYGFKVEWNGLPPTLIYKGRDTYLPNF